MCQNVVDNLYLSKLAFYVSEACLSCFIEHSLNYTNIYTHKHAETHTHTDTDTDTHIHINCLYSYWPIVTT